MAENVKKPTEEKLKPKLFSVMKNYSKEQFIKDLIAGVIVAIIALPLSIARIRRHRYNHRLSSWRS